jgi:hypothetical protein
VLGIDIILGAACIALLATNIRDKKLLKENKKLQSQNQTFTQYLLGDGETKPTPHEWGEPVEDLVFTSKSPVSYDKVVLQVSSCSRCKIVSKHIIQGQALAQKKGMLDLEGFFFAGVKVTNSGCLRDGEEELLE